MLPNILALLADCCQTGCWSNVLDLEHETQSITSKGLDYKSCCSRSKGKLNSVYFLIQRNSSEIMQALFLPEASDYISHTPDETLSLVQSVEDSIYVQGLQKQAKRFKIAINAGIHEPGEPKSGKIKNTSIWISEDGEIIQRYQKLHLFEMNLTNGPHAREGE